MSDSQDDSQKTEEPTGKKLGDARKKGQIAQSKEVTNFASLLALTFAVTILAPYMAIQLYSSMAVVIEHAAVARIDAGSTSFWAAKNRTSTDVAGLGILERQRVKVWLNHAYDQLDGLHL